MIITRTPFRISFFGGGTDFPGFFKEHGGSTLLTSIDKYCYILIHDISPLFNHRFHASYAKSETVVNPEDFVHPLIRETLLMLNIEKGLEIAHVSDLPGRTGLGSSSSFTVGLLLALHKFMGNEISPERLALESIDVERVRVADPGGLQDQYAAAYGGLIRLDFSGDNQVAVKKLKLDENRRKELESHLLLFYTGIEQTAESILNHQVKRIKDNTPALLEMLQMVDEAENILCSNSSIGDFGRLLHESWQLKKSLADGISTSAMDDAYDAALAAGADGGKILGAGGRGFLLISSAPETHDKIRERLHPLREVDCSFSSNGSEIIL